MVFYATKLPRAIPNGALQRHQHAVYFRLWRDINKIYYQKSGKKSTGDTFPERLCSVSAMPAPFTNAVT